MKRCSKCGEAKPLSAFSLRKDRPSSDGRTSQCRDCLRQYHISPDEARARRLANPVVHTGYDKTWRDANPHKVAAKSARRRAAKYKAKPAWANAFFIEEIYDLAQRRTKLLGVPHVVDHIVPLNSPLVCGLHTERNLRVISAAHNLAKSNKYWPDMPS